MLKPFGITIFCDDVRSEIGGKFTYVGVYSANLQITGEAPATLPKLACVIQIVIPFGFSFEKFRLVVKMQAEGFERLITEISSPPPPPVSEQDRVIKQVLNMIMAPFVVESDGRLMVRAYFDDLEVKLGALDIKIEAQESSPEAYAG
jgi:hypothetical protein